MSSTTFTVHTSLSPNEVMALMTDFGPTRVANWPNIDEAHFEVHETGPDWAEVTEGTAMGWERERYSWDAAAGTIAIETLDSNLWAPGSGWRYQLTPADGRHRRAGDADPRPEVDRRPGPRGPDPRRRRPDPGQAARVGVPQGRVPLRSGDPGTVCGP